MKPRSGAGDSIWQVKAVRHRRRCTFLGIGTVHLSWQARQRAEVLEIPIERVCKVDIAVTRMNGYIIKRVELAAKEVVYEHCKGFRKRMTKPRPPSSPVVLYGSRGFITTRAEVVSLP